VLRNRIRYLFAQESSLGLLVDVLRSAGMAGKRIIAGSVGINQQNMYNCTVQHNFLLINSD
jgi:hypothetical protein